MSAQNRELDVSGVPAPFYVLRAKQALDQLAIGQVLAVISDAPHATREIRAWIDHAGHQLMASEKRDGRHRFLIRRL